MQDIFMLNKKNITDDIPSTKNITSENLVHSGEHIYIILPISYMEKLLFKVKGFVSWGLGHAQKVQFISICKEESITKTLQRKEP